MDFGRPRGARRGGLSKETEQFLAETLRAGGASKRAVEHALNDASVGRFGASSRNAGSVSRPPHPKTHGVVAPRVGRAGTNTHPTIPAYRAGIKPRETIARDASHYQREQWNGTQTRRGVDIEAEKAKLAATMARRSFSTRREETDVSERERRSLEEKRLSEHEKRRDEQIARRHKLKTMSPDDLCDELAREVDERWAFLEDMQRAGKGDEHRARVTAEIAERVRQMKRLDEIISRRDFS